MKCCRSSVIFGFHDISMKMTGMDFMGCISMHISTMASSGRVRMGFLACGVAGFLMGGIMLLGRQRYRKTGNHDESRNEVKKSH
jgi:hypothetical protein